MADDFKMYLATEILSEQRTLTYRNVARVFQIHVHAAKCILFDFYESQNKKKPGSVYATYILSGVKKRPSLAGGENGKRANGHKHKYDEDEALPSSPPPFTSSMLEPSQESSQAVENEDISPNVAVKTITLTREESLEDIKAQYESLDSIHIYSLAAARIPDLVTLTDVGRGLFVETFVKEDPLIHTKIYGVIQNPDVRRRKGKNSVIPPGPAPTSAAAKALPKPLPAAKPASAAKSTSKPSTAHAEEVSRPSSRDSTSTNASAKQPTLKRDASDLFKAFAKHGQRKPAPATAPDEDTKMHDDDDDDEGESEDEALFLDTGTHKPAKKRVSEAKQMREDKAAKLRKMMDSDDDEEPAPSKVEKAASVDPEAATGPKGPDPPGDEGEVEWSESDTDTQTKTAAAIPQDQPPPATGPRRRRGKRKVLKKRTMKDEDGYLVTKEEETWESFSEDEPEPPPPKPASQPPRSSLGASKGPNSKGAGPGAKGGAKKGGNIMSFFGKKN